MEKIIEREIKRFKESENEEDKAFIRNFKDRYNQTFNKLHRENPVRFTQKLQFYGSFTFSVKPLTIVFQDPEINSDSKLKCLGQNFFRFLGNPQYMFENTCLLRYYNIASKISKRLQTKDLSSTDVINHLRTYKNEILTLGLPENIEILKTAARRTALENKNKFHDNMGIRQTRSLTDSQDLPINSSSIEAGLDYSLIAIDQMIEAEQVPRDPTADRDNPAWLVSSMNVERYFSTKEFLLNDLTNSTSIDYLWLKMFGLKHRSKLLNIDALKMAKEFLETRGAIE